MKNSKHRSSYYGKIFTSPLLMAIVVVFFAGCTNESQVIIGEPKVVAQPADLNPTTSEVLKSSLEEALENNGHLSSLNIRFVTIVQDLYAQNDFQPLWTNAGQWVSKADSLFQFINKARSYGLFPEDYYQAELTQLRQETLAEAADSTKKLDASLWAKTDLLLTSALINVTKDLKLGRLVSDSIVQKDTIFNKAFCEKQLAVFQDSLVVTFAAALEPKHEGYKELKEALANFLPQADLQKYTYVEKKDSLNLVESVQKRLSEQDTLLSNIQNPDSSALAASIKRYQKSKKLKSDGKITARLIDSLNQTDREKFIRIAITLDRYKQLSPLPAKYIWVNIPAYQMQVIDSGISVLTSRVVVGKPNTRTPLLTSAITDMITYPKWHIPNSIIVKEILPNLKKDRGYLAKKGYILADYKGNEIDPLTVNWSKYEKSIPYRVIQGSGDDNALGVLKFNFPNKYSVYLHDTNQRHLFSKGKRALSHGCVRVQAWEELAYYLLQQDTASTNAVPVDSLLTWLAVKEKHVVPLRNRLPLYIRYFTCEAENGELVMHEDIYGDDLMMRQKYFLTK